MYMYVYTSLVEIDIGTCSYMAFLEIKFTFEIKKSPSVLTNFDQP